MMLKRCALRVASFAVAVLTVSAMALGTISSLAYASEDTDDTHTTSVHADHKVSNKKACRQARLEKNASKPTPDADAPICRVHKGHTDIIAAYLDKKGNLVLGTKGDAFPGTQKNDVRYDPSRLEFVVTEKSRVQKDNTFSFVKENVDYVYRLSAELQTDELYAGLATETLPENTNITSVTFSIANATMPQGGALYMGQYETAKADMSGMLGTGGTGFPASYTANGRVHQHFNWVFTVPGKYVFTIVAKAHIKDGKTLKAQQDYTFDVGGKPAQDEEDDDDDNDNEQSDEEDEDDKEGNKKDKHEDEDEDEDAEDAEDAESEDGDGEEEDGADYEPDDSDDLTRKPQHQHYGKGKVGAQCTTLADLKKQGKKTLVISNGHVDIAAYGNKQGMGLAVQEDVTGSHVRRSPSSVVFSVQKKISNAWIMPQTQVSGLPWLGWNNQHMRPHVPVRLMLKSIKGPGKVRVWTQGGLGVPAKTIFSSNGSRSYTIPSNTHMHVNWSFSKPGYYTLRFMASHGNNSVAKDFHIAVGVDPMKTPMWCSTDKGDDGTQFPEPPEEMEEKEDTPQQPVNNGNTSSQPSHGGFVGNTGFGGGASRGGSSHVGSSSLHHSGNKKQTTSLPMMKKDKAKEASEYEDDYDNDDEEEEGPTGIVGLFTRQPLVASAILGVGTSVISGVGYGGFVLLKRRGLI